MPDLLGQLQSSCCFRALHRPGHDVKSRAGCQAEVRYGRWSHMLRHKEERACLPWDHAYAEHMASLTLWVKEVGAQCEALQRARAIEQVQQAESWLVAQG